MTLHSPTPSRRTIECHMLDVSSQIGTQFTAYCAVPWKCRLVKLHVTTYLAVSGSDSTVTCSVVHGAVTTAITGGTITVAVASAAAGKDYECTPTAQTYLVEGDSIKFSSDGASSTTTASRCWAELELMDN